MEKGKIKTTFAFFISIMFFLFLFNNNFSFGSEFKSSNYNISDFLTDNSNLINSYNDKSILHVGGGGKNNYTLIQDAINDSKNGDIIFVWGNSSPYYENIIINKKINLIGQDKNTTIINGGGKEDVITVNVDEVFISGFKIINSGTDWIDSGIKLNSDNNRIDGNIFSNNNFGIYSYNLENTIISNNFISFCYDSGIHLPFSKNITITNNIIINNSLKGIYLYDSNVHCDNRNNISDNIIKFNKVGIYFWYSYRTDISRNIISDNDYGISFNHNSDYNIIDNNTITKNTFDGIYLNFSSYNQLTNNELTNNINGFHLIYSSDCDIINNRIVGYNEIGLYLQCSSNTYIFNNYFSNNDIYGLYLYRSSKSYIVSNYIIHNNNIGIYLNQNSNDNIIEYNNFINQLTHSFFKNTFRNWWNNNFWDDWDKEGIYRIFGKIYLLNDILIFNWMNFDLNPSEHENR